MPHRSSNQRVEPSIPLSDKLFSCNTSAKLEIDDSSNNQVFYPTEASHLGTGWVLGVVLREFLVTVIRSDQIFETMNGRPNIISAE